jgi:DNA-directed RNA polymerase subunit E'/Rpb7
MDRVVEQSQILEPEAVKALTDKPRRRKPKTIGIYTTALITRRVVLHITNVGNNIRQTLERVVASQIEGKCVVEGFVKPGSSRIQTYSSGQVQASNIAYEVVFQCQVCTPVEGMHIDCVAKNVTKAGVRAEVNEDPSPVVIFVARDHHSSEYFANIKEGQSIKVRVIGQRFELNDKYVSVIAEVIEPREEKQRQRRKPKLVIQE